MAISQTRQRQQFNFSPPKKRKCCICPIECIRLSSQLVVCVHVCVFFPSFPPPPPHLLLSELLRRSAPLPLLRADNKPLHSSADSSSPKATLIVLKHTAPVKLIIALACFHSVVGQRTQNTAAEPPPPLFLAFSRPRSRLLNVTFQMWQR